jgi:hypothetical protein
MQTLEAALQASWAPAELRLDRGTGAPTGRLRGAEGLAPTFALCAVSPGLLLGLHAGIEADT